MDGSEINSGDSVSNDMMDRSINYANYHLSITFVNY